VLIRTILIEDELVAREHLTFLPENYCPNLQVVGRLLMYNRD